MTKKLDVDKIMSDKIAYEWVCFCLARDLSNPKDWFERKSHFFEKNKEHLQSLGLSDQRKGLNNALDEVALQKFEHLTGSLLIVKVGNGVNPAVKEDIDIVRNLFSEVAAKYKNLCVLIVSRDINVQQFSLPQLKRLENQAIETMDQHTTNQSPNVISDIDI